jgi:hypothetical protein
VRDVAPDPLLAESVAPSRFMTEEASDRLLAELYPEERLFDDNDFLEHPYEFTFKGDPALVEAIFQAVGFVTQHGLLVPDDGSETHHRINIAPPSLAASCPE